MTDRTERKVLPVVGFLIAVVRLSAGPSSEQIGLDVLLVLVTATVMGRWLWLGRYYGFTRKPWRFLLAGIIIWLTTDRKNDAAWWPIVEWAGNAALGTAVIAWLLAITVGRASWRREVRFFTLAFGVPLAFIGVVVVLASSGGGGVLTLSLFDKPVSFANQGQQAVVGFGILALGVALILTGRWAVRSALRRPRTPRSE